jgi:hypothetical protein
MEEQLFQQWIKELNSEISRLWGNSEDGAKTIFALYRTAQNLLSLAAGIRAGSNGEVFCNLMVYEPSKDQLRVVLTHGFYYEEVFQRVFPLRSKDGHDKSGTCGIAFRDSKIKFVDDAFTDPDTFWEQKIRTARENMRSIINIPLSDFGVLNVDSRNVDWFVPHERYEPRAIQVQQIATKYMAFYTIANPFVEQYWPRTFRNTRPQSLPNDLRIEMAFVERCIALGVLPAAYLYMRRAIEKICNHLGVKPTADAGAGRALSALRSSRNLDPNNYQILRDLNSKANEVIHEDLPVSREEVAPDLARLESAVSRIHFRA